MDGWKERGTEVGCDGSDRWSRRIGTIKWWSGERWTGACSLTLGFRCMRVDEQIQWKDSLRVREAGRQMGTQLVVRQLYNHDAWGDGPRLPVLTQCPA